jgi:hypothetical protein
MSLFCGSLLLPAAASAAGNSCTVTGGKTIPTVLELYTSEGCDSCPPIDRWFSTLKDDAARGKVVPLAFHVDYWDYIGWKDRFGDPKYSARQREAASRGGARVVYTPQVFLDGREFQPWRRASDKLPAGPSKPAKAELQVAGMLTPSATSSPQVRIEIDGRSAQPASRAEAYVALFENGLSSDVKAGENKGVLLRHDFVVRRWLGPFAFERGRLNVSQNIDLPVDGVVAQSGIAVVAVDERGAILQAVSLPLRECAG